LAAPLLLLAGCGAAGDRTTVSVNINAEACFEQQCSTVRLPEVSVILTTGDGHEYPATSDSNGQATFDVGQREVKNGRLSVTKTPWQNYPREAVSVVDITVSEGESLSVTLQLPRVELVNG
jgi:hypothetical protein